jgi:pyruvate/oxaloacetate carboxyltransferase
MISNLRHQLKLMGKEEKLDQVLEETARVRAELGLIRSWSRPSRSSSAARRRSM